MILYAAVTAFFNAAVSIVCGAAVLIKEPRQARNQAYAVMGLALTIWSAAYFFWQLAGTAQEALDYCRLLTAGAAVILVAYYHFVRLLLGLQRDAWVIIGYVVSIFLVLLSPTSLLVRDVAPKLMFPHWPEPGPLYPLYLVVFIGYGLASWGLIARAYRRAPSARLRNQLRWVLVGTTVGLLGGCTNFFLWYDIPIPPVGNPFVGFYMAAVGYAILRLRLLEVDYAMIKLGAYVLAVVPLAGVVVLTERLVSLLTASPEQRLALWHVSAAVLVGAAFLGVPPLRRRIDRILASTLLREQFERREELGGFAGRISSMHDDETIAGETARVIAEVLEAPAAVYLRGDLEPAFEPRSATGFRDGSLPPRLTESDVLVQVLTRHRMPLRFDELDAQPGIDGAPETLRALQALHTGAGVQLALPVMGDLFFFGFVLVGYRSKRRLLTELDISLLDSIALHIGLNLRARQLERRANQTEKLISLGTLAAGLAHELRNPLVSIQTLAQLLDELGETVIPADFKSTVMRDVKRIVGIVENVSAFATNNKVTLAWVSLADVVRQAEEIVRADFLEAGVAFDFESDGSTHLVRANQNQMLQVVINMLNNAAQALRGREGARVQVRLRARQVENDRDVLELSICDNGPGIDPEILPRMFEPFTTTKATGMRTSKGGMGLGLAIVKRIVDGHNGHISVTSRQGEGTTFLITLPCEEVLV